MDHIHRWIALYVRGKERPWLRVGSRCAVCRAMVDGKRTGGYTLAEMARSNLMSMSGIRLHLAQGRFAVSEYRDGRPIVAEAEAERYWRTL